MKSKKQDDNIVGSYGGYCTPPSIQQRIKPTFISINPDNLSEENIQYCTILQLQEATKNCQGILTLDSMPINIICIVGRIIGYSSGINKGRNGDIAFHELELSDDTDKIRIQIYKDPESKLKSYLEFLIIDHSHKLVNPYVSFLSDEKDSKIYVKAYIKPKKNETEKKWKFQTLMLKKVNDFNEITRHFIQSISGSFQRQRGRLNDQDIQLAFKEKSQIKKQFQSEKKGQMRIEQQQQKEQIVEQQQINFEKKEQFQIKEELIEVNKIQYQMEEENKLENEILNDFQISQKNNSPKNNIETIDQLESQEFDFESYESVINDQQQSQHSNNIDQIEELLANIIQSEQSEFDIDSYLNENPLYSDQKKDQNSERIQQEENQRNSDNYQSEENQNNFNQNQDQINNYQNIIQQSPQNPLFQIDESFLRSVKIEAASGAKNNYIQSENDKNDFNEQFSTNYKSQNKENIDLSNQSFLPSSVKNLLDELDQQMFEQ